MARIKISELPSASADLTSVVPASDAGGTTTNKISIGSIIDLVNAGMVWEEPTFLSQNFTASVKKSYYIKPNDVGYASPFYIYDPLFPSHGDYYFFWLPYRGAPNTYILGNGSPISGYYTVKAGQMVARIFDGGLSPQWFTQPVNGVPYDYGTGNFAVKPYQGSNQAAGDYSSVAGGVYNIASGNYSNIPGGSRAKAELYGSLAHASGDFSNVGDAQHYILVARNVTSDNTPTKLFLDGTSKILSLPLKSTWTFQVKISAYNDFDDESAGWIISGTIKRDNADNTVLVGGSIVYNWAEFSLSTATASVSADDVNEALSIDVTGIFGKIVRWVAIIDVAQVIF